jgi:hypothetical protein
MMAAYFSKRRQSTDLVGPLLTNEKAQLKVGTLTPQN